MKDIRLSENRLFETLESRHLLAANLVADLGTVGVASSPNFIGEFDGKAVFTADNPNGQGLFVSDGTTSGTQVIRYADHVDSFITPIGVFFQTKVELENGSDSVTLWFTDTSNDTRELANFQSADSHATFFSYRLAQDAQFVYGTAFFDGRLYTATSDDMDSNLLESDGTPEGTRFVGNGLRHQDLMVMGNDLFLIRSTEDDENMIFVKKTGVDTFEAVPGTEGAASLDKLEASQRIVFGVQSDMRRIFALDRERNVTELFPTFARYHNNVRKMAFSDTGFYFRANDASISRLWYSDGTLEGTTQLLHESAHPSNGNVTRADGDTSYFHVVDEDKVQSSNTKSQIWKHVPGNDPELVKELPSLMSFEAWEAGRLHFKLGNSYWVSDGTEEGTLPLVDVAFSNLVSTELEDDRILFSSQDAELWVSDGTPSGTKRVGEGFVDQRPAFIGGTPSFGTFRSVGRSTVQLANGSTLFSGSENNENFELWTTGANDSAPRLVAELNPSTNSADFANSKFDGLDQAVDAQPGFVPFNGKYYFGAVDGLYRTDGTEAGTDFVFSSARPRPDNRLDIPTGAVDEIGTVGDQLFFFTTRDREQPEHELWVINGTDEPTRVWSGDLTGFRRDAKPYDHVVVDGKFYFRLSYGRRHTQLWTSDGTETGTRMLVETTANLMPTQFVPMSDGNVLFWDASNSRQSLLQSFNPVSGQTTTILESNVPSSQRNLFRLDGGVVFANGGQLFRTNGTSAGTQPYFDLQGTPTDVSELDGALYMTIGTDGGSYDLRTKGTVESTNRLARLEIEPNSQLSVAKESVLEVGDELFFWLGNRLVRGDGSDSGSRIIREFPESYRRTTHLNRMVQSGDFVYFTISDPQHGSELWMTDGTSEGTQLAADIFPGAMGSDPTRLTPIDGGVLFSATDQVHSEELWKFESDVVRGDLNDDGEVSFADFIILSANFGQSDMGRADGDIDGDNQVTFADFLVLAKNFGQKVGD